MSAEPEHVQAKPKVNLKYVLSYRPASRTIAIHTDFQNSDASGAEKKEVSFGTWCYKAISGTDRRDLGKRHGHGYS